MHPDFILPSIHLDIRDAFITHDDHWANGLLQTLNFGTHVFSANAIHGGLNVRELIAGEVRMTFQRGDIQINNLTFTDDGIY